MPARAATSEAHSPAFDLPSEFLGGDGAAGVDVLEALLDLSERVEPIDDLIEGNVVGEPFDGVESFLLGRMRVHGANSLPGSLRQRAVEHLQDELLLGLGQAGEPFDGIQHQVHDQLALRLRCSARTAPAAVAERPVERLTTFTLR